MTYNYQNLKSEIITDEGQKILMQTWEKIRKILEISETITMGKAMAIVGCCDSWTQMAYIDRLVELGYLDEIKISHHVAGQHRTFWSKK